MKKITDNEMRDMKIKQLEEEIMKLKATIQRLEIGLEMSGLEINVY